MSASPTTSEPTKQVDDPAEKRGRAYMILGALVILGLLAVAALGVLGVTSPGILTARNAFFVMGASILVLAIATTVLLFSLRRTMEVLRQHKELIDQQQDERATIMREQQGIRDRLQDQRLTELVESQERRDQEQDQRMANLVAAQEARFEALVARMEREFEAIVSHQEGRIEDLASGVDHDAPKAAARGPTPFGDIHPVIDVEGIGEIYEKKLEALNVVDTEQLWLADASELAASLDVPEKTVRSWQAMAELMALDRVGPQYAELLVRAGIDSIEKLKTATPDALSAEVEAVEADRDVRVQGNVPSPKRVEAWIEAARSHDPKAQRVRR